MLRQIIGNDDIMLDIALALFEHLIVNNISLNNCIDWFHKLSVAPEILLPLLHNTHHKQYMLLYPFGFWRPDLFVRLEHAEINITPSDFAMVQIVNGYHYFSCLMNRAWFDEFLDLAAIETMRVFMIFFGSPIPVCDALGVDDPSYFKHYEEKIKKKLL